MTSSAASAAAAAAGGGGGGSRGRGLPFITSSVLNDAIRRVRPTAAGEAPPPRRQDDRDAVVLAPGGERSPAGARRLQPRPVTMDPAAGGTAVSVAGDWLAHWPACDVDNDRR